MRPITFMKTAHTLLPMNSELLSRTLCATGGIVYSWNVSSDLMEWSEGAGAVLGLDDKDLPLHGADLKKLIAPDDQPARAIPRQNLNCQVESIFPHQFHQSERSALVEMQVPADR